MMKMDIAFSFSILGGMRPTSHEDGMAAFGGGYMHFNIEAIIILVGWEIFTHKYMLFCIYT